MSLIQNIKFLTAFSKFTRSIQKDSTMKNWLPSLIALLGSGATIFMPQLQAIVASHPAVLSAIGAAAVIISHLLPSPLSAPKGL